MDIIIIDFEVWRYLWFLGYKVHGSDEKKHIINDWDELAEFVETNKGNILVGHNIDGYDDFILRALMDGKSNKEVYDLSNQIVEQNMRWGKKSGLVTYDTMQQPVIAMAQYFSLKTIALFFGRAGYECSVPWDLDRELTEGELEEAIVYNNLDLDICDEVFSYHKNNNFLTKIQYCNTFNLPVNSIAHTWGTLAAKRTEFVPGLKIDKNDITYKVPETLDLPRHQELIKQIPLKGKVTGKNIKYIVGGLEHLLGEGGCHSALKNVYLQDVWVADVTSYYPAMMDNYRYMQSRTMHNQGLVGETMRTRVELKRKGDPSQASYKEWLVTMYGITNNQYSPFFDPSAQHRIAISGQLFLLDLSDKLEQALNEFVLVQDNTDGIFFQTDDIDYAKEIAVEWEERTGFALEYDKFDVMYQKDVNNYFAFKYDEDYMNGIITQKNFKGKGTYATKYFPIGTDTGENPLYYEVNNRWLSIGLVRLLTRNELDISDLDAIDLQIILQKVSYNHLSQNGKNIGNAVRIYPVITSYNKQHGQIYRTKYVKDKETLQYVEDSRKVGPPNAFVYQDQVLDVPDTFYNMIDYDYYYDEIVDKAIDFGYRGIHALNYISNIVHGNNMTPARIKKELKRIGLTSLDELDYARDCL